MKVIQAASNGQPLVCRRLGTSVWDAPLHLHIARLICIPTLLYILFLVLLTYPPFQRLMIFLHKAKWPLFPKYDTPEAYGFAPNKARNLYIRTPDGVRIGLWHVLPETYARRFPLDVPTQDAIFDDCLRFEEHKVMLFMHGNAASRLQSQRLHLARHISGSDMDMHFVIFDYRGFADSSNAAPSEAGLCIDARSVWDWLTVEKGVGADRIVLAGQSLGTGVACALAGRSLAAEGVIPRALILIAPFTSILDVLLTYKLLEIIPVLQPLRYLPWLKDYLFSYLQTSFDSNDTIQDIHCPVLFVHSLDDGTIPPSHSQALFRRLVEASAQANQLTDITTQKWGKYATLRTFVRDTGRAKGTPVIHLEVCYGGHNEIAYSGLALRCMKNTIEASE